jgi:hypothetical protein
MGEDSHARFKGRCDELFGDPSELDMFLQAPHGDRLTLQATVRAESISETLVPQVAPAGRWRP